MKKLIHFIFNKKHEKTVLILLPLLSIVIASCVLIPQIITIVRIYKEQPPTNTSVVSMPATTQEISSTADTPAPSSTPTSEVLISVVNDEKAITLSARSIEKDLYIFVRDENGNPVTGVIFTINVKYPDGQIGSYKSETDGTCYVVYLTPGTYTISMEKQAGYSLPASITCSVIESVAYQQIENVEEIVEIKDISQGLNEIKTNQANEASQETTIDYIDTTSEVTSTNSNVTTFVLDSNGHQTYKYTYKTDSSGYLLFRNGESSDVIPNEENSVLVCGLRYNKEISSYETINLFQDDNLPISDYWIDAEPVTISQTETNGWQNENGKIVYYRNGSKVSGLKNIDGKLFFFDSYGYEAESVGIDVSFYNGNINWAAVKNAGIDYVIVRLGFRGWGSATIYQDTCFEQNLRNAKAAGLKVGVYFYSTAVNKVEAVEEASICLEWLKNRALDYPVYIDMEFSGDYPSGRQDTLSPATRTEIALAFCETIKSGGYLPGIYATQSFLRDEINYNSVSQYSIWMASFTENYELPTTSLRYDIWQFTDFGKVAGINGSTDFNVIFKK